MTMIVIGSVRSSGATTLALALAGCLERAVLVEADPDGGVLALRYGLAREPGLATLAASRAEAGGSILEHAQALPGGLPAVVGPESPAQATRLLATAGKRLLHVLAGASEELQLVVDAGRLGPSSPAAGLLAAADVVLVVARPTAEALVGAAERVADLGPSAGLVLAGPGPYRAEQVSAQLGCPVLATVADDARAAGTLAEGGSSKTLARSALLRSARSLAENLAAATTRSRPPAAAVAEHSEVWA